MLEGGIKVTVWRPSFQTYDDVLSFHMDNNTRKTGLYIVRSFYEILYYPHRCFCYKIERVK